MTDHSGFHADKLDYASAAMGASYVAWSLLDAVDWAEKLIAGGLVIAILILRFRAQRRRDRAEMGRNRQ